MPIKNLFDSLGAGETLEEFLDGFEGVSREQAVAVLELAGWNLLGELKLLWDQRCSRRRLLSDRAGFLCADVARA